QYRSSTEPTHGFQTNAEVMGWFNCRVRWHPRPSRSRPETRRFRKDVFLEGAPTRLGHGAITFARSPQQFVPTALVLLKGLQRHKCILGPAFIGTMDVICDVLVSCNEVANRLSSGLITNQDINGDLVAQRAGKIRLANIPWCGAYALDLH